MDEYIATEFRKNGKVTGVAHDNLLKAMRRQLSAEQKIRYNIGNTRMTFS